MLRLDEVIKPWKESAALNDHINLYGFWNETAFLTKSGDLGMVLIVVVVLCWWLLGRLCLLASLSRCGCCGCSRRGRTKSLSASQQESMQ